MADDFVEVPGIGIFSRNNDFANVNWFEVTRMNMRNQMSQYGLGGLADNDEAVRAWGFFYDASNPAPDRELAYQRVLNLAGASQGPGSGSSGPSTAQQAANIEAELRNLAGMLGVSDRDWTSVSWEAAKNNWNVTMIRDHVANLIDASSFQRAGLVKDVSVKSRDAAANYFMKVSDEDILGWSRAIGSGEMNEESIVSSIRDKAKAQYYWLAPVIDQGVTLQEYFKPHRDQISKLLEVTPESIDFMNDPKWQSVVRRTPDDQDGTERAMNLNETAKYVRSMDEWKKTSNAKSTSASAVSSIGRVLGVL
jgi:hypothetical protein